MNEELIKTGKTAELLAQDIRAAHSAACRENPVAEIVIYDIIWKVAEIQMQLRKLNQALKES